MLNRGEGPRVIFRYFLYYRSLMSIVVVCHLTKINFLSLGTTLKLFANGKEWLVMAGRKKSIFL